MIVLDIETSSADPYNWSVLSIWALEFENPENQFYGECRLLDWAEVQEKALEVNWFTLSQIKDDTKQTVYDLLNNFSNWFKNIRDRTIWWHNVGYFDLRFLEENAKKVNAQVEFWLLKWNYRTVDLHSVCYSYLISKKIEIPFKNNQSAINLDFVLQLVWLPMEPRPHNWLNWAKYEAEAFSRLLYWRKLLKEFEIFEIPIEL